MVPERPAVNRYAPPLDEIEQALRQHAGMDDAAPGGVILESDVVAGVLHEAGRFMAAVLAPLNRIGDRQGCRFVDGRVTTPEGFREAYGRFTEAGWGALDVEPAYGGGGLPTPVAVAVEEMVAAANPAFSLCPMLTRGAVELLSRHGGPEHRPFLERMVTGECTGTMCLTEPD